MNNNKLIAEFMGLSGRCNGKYDKSWDWLMPVVEKCYESGAEENEVGDITHALLDCDIKETYNAVVEFIKEYNKENN